MTTLQKCYRIIQLFNKGMITEDEAYKLLINVFNELPGVTNND